MLLMQHAPQGHSSVAFISPCLAPMGLQPQGCPASSSPSSCVPICSVSHSRGALGPLAANTGSHARHRKCKGKQSHALCAYLPGKRARHFFLSSPDEWCCLSCEIGLQIPLKAQLLVWSLQLQPLQEPFGRPYPLMPGRIYPTASHHPHLPS